ncbi:RNA 2'-phosphotransferase [Rhodopirellula islandica]|uniref:RNA 2'-phosphotransferase n=1 Tax=Rhodopirellula islandica TaxID=595434 RepID=UPI0021BC201A
MNNDPSLVSTSKFLSLVLRHQPEVIGLKPDAEGWLAMPMHLFKRAEEENAPAMTRSPTTFRGCGHPPHRLRRNGTLPSDSFLP